MYFHSLTNNGEGFISTTGFVHALQEKKGKSMGIEDDDWQDIEMTTISTIYLSLIDNVPLNVIYEDSTLILWGKLEKLYMGKSFTYTLYLKRQLYGMKMVNGVNLLEYLNVFN